MNNEKFDLPTIPKTNNPILDSIRKILSVRDVLVRLELNESTMVRCAHDENFLQRLETFVDTKDITNLSRKLEPDFPDISEQLGLLGGELELAKQRYVMAWGGKTKVYLLPDSRWFQFCVQKDFFDWRKEISSDANCEDPMWEHTARTLTVAYPAELKKVVAEICDKLRQVETVLLDRMKKPAETKPQAALTQRDDEINAGTARNKEGDTGNIGGDDKGTTKPSNPPVSIELNLIARMLTIGEQTKMVTSESVWSFLKTLADDKRTHQFTPHKNEHNDWKGAMDTLRRFVEKGSGSPKNSFMLEKGFLHKIVLSRRGYCTFDPSVVIQGGSQVAIRPSRRAYKRDEIQELYRPAEDKGEDY